MRARAFRFDGSSPGSIAESACGSSANAKRGLVSERLFAKVAAVEKKRLRRIHALAEKLKALPELDEAERMLYAEHLLMTPDERWERNHRYIQLVNSSKLLRRPKSASSSPG